MRMRVRGERFVFLREFFTKCETLHLDPASTRVQSQKILVFNIFTSFPLLNQQNRLVSRVEQFFEIMLIKQEIIYIYLFQRQCH